jgi:tape measure domain-containing protein
VPSIDERVVSMAFENAKFEAGVATTMATLSKLDVAIKTIGTTSGLQNIEAQANKVTLQGPMSALDKLKAKLGMAGQGAAEGLGEIDKAGNKVTLEGPGRALDKVQGKMDQLNAGSTFSDIEKASNQVELGGLTRALDNVAGKFSMLQGVATVALGNITSQAALKGGAFAKSFAFGPLQQGLQEYQTNLNSIQTILANTQGQQVTGLGNVNKYLGELNEYSDKTIYNFGEMAKNIGTFTAAGVDLPKSTEAIKGIANLAALSGSNSQQASTAMYQLSQAIAAGRVGLQDWNSVVNAGMGGAVFQKALMRTAENMGAVEKGAVKIDKATGKATVNGQSFRESIMAKPGEQSWLTSDVLTKTLGQFTGDLSDADLAAQGFSKSQIKAIQAQAKTAQEAATQVKTLPQVFDVARETIGSGWAKTFQNIFGDFEESKKTFTEFSNFLNGFINKVSDARNKVLAEWKKLGGRTELIEGIKAAFDALMGVVIPIKDAFREIFPAKTGQDLFDLTKKFREFMENIKPSEETMENLKRTFRGFFAVLSIGWTIVKEVGGVIFDLLGVVGKGSGGFLAFTGSIGDFFTALDKTISKGESLKGFFDGLSSVLKVPVELLKVLAGYIGDLFGGSDASEAENFAGSMDTVKDSAKPLADILDKLATAWNGLVDVFEKVKAQVKPVLEAVGEEIANIAGIIKSAIEGADWDSVFLALQTTFIGGIFLAVKKALGGGIADIGGGVMGNLNDMFKGLTGNLEAMQNKIKAQTLLQIAAAIAVLAAGVYILSTIDADKLAKAMTAVAVGMGQLVGALALLTKIGGPAAFAQVPLLAGAMILLSIAVVILAGAMKIMATMDWEELAKGLTGLGGALAALGIGVKLIGPSIIPAALAMIPLAIGLNLLAMAIKTLGGMKWEDLAKGLAGVGGALLAIAAGMGVMPPTLPVTAAGILILSVALILLSGAVSSFGAMDPAKLAQGLIGIGLALAAIGLAIALIPPTIPLTAAGLVILSIALMGIAAAVGLLGRMDIGTLVKGIAAIGGVLVVLAIGLTAMSGTLAGSVALLAAAAALAILAPTLAIMGNLEWSTIFKGLLSIALVLGVLSIVGLVAATGLISLGGALVVLGAGLLVVSAAVYLFAKGLSLLSEGGVKAMAALVAAFGAFLLILPKLIINFVQGLVGIISAVADLLPKVVEAIGKIIDSVIQIVTESAPKLAVAAGILILSILTVIEENAPRIIAGGFKLLMDFLQGIVTNMPQVVTQVVAIITTFLTTMATNAPKLVEGGVKALLAFLKGIADKLPKVIEGALAVVTKFLEGVTTELPKVIAKGTALIVAFLNAIAKQIPKVVAAGVDILLSLIGGIGNAVPRLVKKAVDIIGKFLDTIAEELVRLVRIGFKAIIDFINGLAKAIRENDQKLIDAGMNLGDAILDGLLMAIKQGAGKIVDAVTGLAGDAISGFKKKLGIGSPSKVFNELGGYMMEGLAIGLEQGGEGVSQSVKGAAQGAANTAKEEFGKIPSMLEGLVDMDPVITPVLDLSQVQKDAKQLDGLTNVVPITAAASLDQAATISASQTAAETAAADQAVQVGPTFQFEQNNYSPEALSDVEIYRQTKNQLSQVKVALGIGS